MEEIDPPNFKPIAVDDAYVAVEDTQLDIAAPGVLANDSDPNDDSLTAEPNFSFLSDNGTVTINPDGSFTYTPDADFNGTDSFTYFASDGQAGDGATVTITVTPVSEAPVATNDSYLGIVAEVPFVVLADAGVLANDEDGDDAEAQGLTAILVSEPENGVVELQADGGFTYTANAGFLGTDTFTYKANDTVHDSNIATVSLFIKGSTIHIGDLDSAVTDFGTTWLATVSITVHDSNEGLVPNATVASIFDMNRSGTQGGSCTTDQLGAPCTKSVFVPRKTRSVIFTVLGVTGAVDYDSSANHDPDGDSNGTSITVFKP